MSPSIELSEKSYERLQSLAGQLFTIPEVIDRLLSTAAPAGGNPPSTVANLPARSPRTDSRLDTVRMRAPRERGATVEVAGQRIHASTVPDLYEQVLRLVLNNGQAEALKALMPYATSNQRYLIAREPKHPNGNSFFVPVKVGPYYVEAHKNYDTAIKQLADLLKKLNVDLRYLG